MSDNINNSPKTKTSGSLWTKESNPSEPNRPVTKADLFKKGNNKLFPNKVKLPNQILNINIVWVSLRNTQITDWIIRCGSRHDMRPFWQLQKIQDL